MPTYDYECTACGHTFEKFQQITARPIRKCPVCGQRKVRRLIGTGAGIIFRGSGFYQTDYRSESYKKAAEKDKPPAGGKKDSGEKKEKKSSGEGASAKADAKGSAKSSEGTGKTD